MTAGGSTPTYGSGTGSARGPATPGLWRLGSPIAGEFTLIFAAGFAEVYFLSRVGDDAVAGYAAMAPVAMLCLVLLKGSAQAFGAVISRRWGEGDLGRVHETQRLALVLSSAAAVVLLTALVSIRGPLAMLIGLSGLAKGYAEEYVLGWSVALMVLAVRFPVAAILAAAGDTRSSMWAYALGNFTWIAANTALSPWIVQQDHPVLWITLIIAAGYAVNLSFLLIRAWPHLRGCTFHRGWSRGALKAMRAMARVIGPGIVEPAQFNLFMIVVVALTARLGPDALSARAYTAQLTTIAFFYSISIAQAAQILTTRALGSGDIMETERRFRHARVRSTVGALLLGVLLWVSSPVLLRLFTIDEGVIELAGTLFLIGLVLEPARSLSATTNSVLIGVGEGFYVLLTGVIASWLVGLSLMYVLAFPLGLGLAGIWLAMAFDEILRASVATLRWRHWTRRIKAETGVS